MPPKSKAARKAVVPESESAVEEQHAPVVPSVPPTEVYAALQAVVAADASKLAEHVEEVRQLVAAINYPETSLLLRVKFLEFVGAHVADLGDDEAVLKEFFLAVVKVVAGDDNTPELLIAALQCFAGFGPVSARTPSLEYIPSEGSDVVMQVIADKDAFPENVRAVANKVLDSLSDTALLPVVKKLVQWVSTNREPDDEEQIAKERHLALARLTRLVMSPSLRAKWTPEVQQATFTLLKVLFPTVDAREFNQIMRLAAHLPFVRDEHGAPLVEAVLADADLTQPRGLEMLAAAVRHLPATAEYDLLPALESAGVLSRDIDAADDSGVAASRIILFASRGVAKSSVENAAGKLLSFVATQLVRLASTPDDVNLTTLEALLFSFVKLANVALPVEAIQKLNEETFAAAMVALNTAMERTEKLVKFAVLKAVDAHTAEPRQADILAALRNIVVISGAFVERHLPLGDIRESWIGQNKLPASPSRQQQQQQRGQTLPTTKGGKRSRSAMSSGSRNGNNGNNNNNNNSKNNRHGNRNNTKNRDNRSSSRGPSGNNTKRRRFN